MDRKKNKNMSDRVYNLLIRPKVLRDELSAVVESLVDVNTRLGIGAINYDKDNVQTSHEDRMPNLVIRRVELLKKKGDLGQEIDEAEEKIRRYVDRIREPVERKILIAKWLNGKDIEKEIAKEIGYSDRSTYMIYKAAKDSLDKVLQEEEFSVNCSDSGDNVYDKDGR